MPRSCTPLLFAILIASILLLTGCIPKVTPTPTPAPTQVPPTVPPTVLATSTPVSSPQVNPTPAAPTPTAPPPPRVGAPAPDFTLASLDGKTVSLSDFRGKKVVLNFFATWCPHCRAETPTLVSFYNDMADQDIVIVAVNLGEGKDKVAAYQKEFSVTFPLLLDDTGAVGQMYYVSSIPLNIFIDAQGIIRSGYVGEIDRETLQKNIDGLPQ